MYLFKLFILFLYLIPNYSIPPYPYPISRKLKNQKKFKNFQKKTFFFQFCMGGIMRHFCIEVLKKMEIKFWIGISLNILER